MVRNIGSIEGNSPATDNGWEAVKRGGDAALRKWISDQMKYRTCTVALVGTDTASRKWINHEIVKSWNDGMGVVGINVHGLEDSSGNVSSKGRNPFEFISYDDSGKKLSSIVKCYSPDGRNSKERNAWIVKHLANAVEEAITIRNSN